MKYKGRAFAVFVIFALLAGGLVPPTAAQSQAESLVKISLDAPGDLAAVEAAGVPVYARLTGADGVPYLLAGATSAQQAALRGRGLDSHVLDADRRGANYYLAYVMPGSAAIDWSAYGRLLLDDGIQVLLRASPQAAETLARTGVELRALTLDPKPLGPSSPQGAIPTSISPDPAIQAMMDQVRMADVYGYTGDLSGEWSVGVGGAPYTIDTRYTYSGEPIQKATQYVGGHLAGLGLSVEYHQWGGPNHPNVIGELTGSTNPNDVFIIGAHLDSTSNDPYNDAPGADDNASGSVATLIAADILTQYEWGCTLRFALWTGEEQGLWGSHYYAQRAYNRGENIVGFLNLDMIAWNSGGTSPGIDLHANSSLPETLVLAQLFADVVTAYNLDLVPQIQPNGTGASDHASFWEFGYTSILGIEDFSDFNPFYHTTNDDMDNFEDWSYYVEFVKASVGTFAHTSGCLMRDNSGYLDGHVTAAEGGAPVVGATVTMAQPNHDLVQTTTDGGGYYTQTLPAGPYTVTAEASGYVSAVVTDVVVVTDAVTTQNLALEMAVPPCAPVEIVTATAEISACTVSFGAELSGTAPFSYTWELADLGSSEAPTLTVDLETAGTYPYTLTVANCAGIYSDVYTGTVTVACAAPTWQFYLPLVVREG